MFTPRTVISILLLLLSCASLSASDVMESLRKYAGRWVGYYKVQSVTSDHAAIFPVEQRYWIEDGRLKGLAVIMRDSELEFSSSVTYRDGDVYVSEVTRGETVEIYLGILREDAIVWYSSDLSRANDYKIEDSFASWGSERIMRTEGFDLRDSEHGRVGVIYEGELIRESD